MNIEPKSKDSGPQESPALDFGLFISGPWPETKRNISEGEITQRLKPLHFIALGETRDTYLLSHVCVGLFKNKLPSANV